MQLLSIRERLTHSVHRAQRAAVAASATIVVAVALVFAVSPAMAGICDGKMTLDEGDMVVIDLARTTAAFSLQARLARNVAVNVDADAFGVTRTGTTQFVQSERPVAWMGELAEADMDPAASQLMISGDNAVLYGKARGQNFATPRLKESDAVRSFQPFSRMAYRFIIPRQTALRIDANGSVTVLAGSTLEVFPVGYGSITARAAARFDVKLVAGDHSDHQFVLPAEDYVVPEGGEMRATILGPEVEAVAATTYFCFRRAERNVKPGAAELAYVLKPARTRTKDGDNTISFAIDVPALEVASDRANASNSATAQAQDTPWPRRYLTEVRALGIAKDGTIVIDATRKITISHPRIAFGQAATMILVAFLIAGAFMRSLSPRKILYGLISRADGRLSLSNLQILLWTVQVVFVLVFVWRLRGVIVDLPMGILGLLGISGSARVADDFIQGGQNTNTTPAISRNPSLADLVQTDGKFDLLRFQMLAFTLFTWVYVFTVVMRNYVFPEIPEHLYWLMGVSNVTYLAGKYGVTPATATNAATTAPANGLSVEQIRQLQRKLGCVETGKVDDGTRAAVISYKTANGIAPANDTIGSALLEKLGIV